MDLETVMRKLSLEADPDQNWDSDIQRQQHERLENLLETIYKELNFRGFTENDVNKISEMIYRGAVMEIICERYVSIRQYVEHNNIDVNLLGNFCEKYHSLLWDVSGISESPTIMRYQDRCETILRQLRLVSAPGSFSRRFELMPNSESIEPSSGSDEFDLDQSSSTNPISSDDSPMCLEEARDALDCALLECDREQLKEENWTNNQLYVNNPNN